MGKTITIDCSKIHNQDDIHNLFDAAFGFPAYYGRNMNAFIDCLTDADDPYGQCTNSVEPGQTITIVLDHYSDLKTRRPDLLEDITECIAFVNWRRVEMSEPAVFCVAFISS